MKHDFSGYATKNDLRCSDGRTIRAGAFADQDGQTVPLVWQHNHNDPENVLGHAVLENRKDGVYAKCSLNSSHKGQMVRELIKHGDIKALSIYANQLRENAGDVMHGVIREVSVVLSGANPGAFIDNVAFAHADGSTTVSEDEAVIYSGAEIALSHADEEEATVADEERTVGDVLDELTPEQTSVVEALMADAYQQGQEEAGAASKAPEAEHSDKEDTNLMHSNVFEPKTEETGATLSHADIQSIVENARSSKGSLSEAFIAHAANKGISNIEALFPDAKSINNPPVEVRKRRPWVEKVLNGCNHSPFSRIKCQQADLTAEELRARGYVKGSKKAEGVLKVAKRVTQPTTIYVKRSLDRDDTIDITDFDVIAWMKGQMRGFLDEELARAILFGDGRAISSPDKINEDCIRPIVSENDEYAVKYHLADSLYKEGTLAKVNPRLFIKEILKTRKHYRGAGSPSLIIDEDFYAELSLIEDRNKRLIYESDAALCSAMRVKEIIPIPFDQGDTFFDLADKNNNENKTKVVAILVNFSDYTIGADKGGQVAMFDDFDIDFNVLKYLMETRVSGSLTALASAVVYSINWDAAHNTLSAGASARTIGVAPGSNAGADVGAAIAGHLPENPEK